uniref:Glycosyltransferase n=1 Tax=viral metagenome TaxID=1070528 RepID=A0A6C0EXJ6_9ZZZZ
MKIGLLIPTTSKGRKWSTIKDSYLYNLTFKTFLLSQDLEHEYVFYIGIDNDDPIYDNKQQKVLVNFNKIFKNVTVKFIYLNCSKGHLTKMWNILFRQAYDENCDYFYQCGDDINFKTKGWVNDCILTLRKNNDVGITGPINNNNMIITQAFVSRTHMKIFNYFFPEEIINWGCDDWYNWVYKPNHFFPLKQHFCSNEGGDPRYDINNNACFRLNYSKNVNHIRNFSRLLAEKHKPLIQQYLI